MAQIPRDKAGWAALKAEVDAQASASRPMAEAASIGAWIVGLAICAGLVAVAAWVVPAVGDWLSYESTWEWWITAYFVAGMIIASLAGLAVFAATWWWSAERWGGVCFVFGWLPAGIITALSWPLIVCLWGPALIIWGLMSD